MGYEYAWTSLPRNGHIAQYMHTYNKEMNARAYIGQRLMCLLTPRSYINESYIRCDDANGFFMYFYFIIE